jgi:hypothetical protein
MDEVDRPYVWFQDQFCRDLGLCNHAEQDWGYANCSASKTEAIAQYYLDHPEYSRVGREMLIESLLSSFHDRLLEDQPPQGTHDLVRRAVQRAMEDLYDRDSLRPFWEVEDKPHDPNPLYGWLRTSFPDWTPPPSVWIS